jgi:hypothetical protein
MADAADRLAFPSASPVSELPFPVVDPVGGASYTTPELLQTYAAVPVADTEATMTMTSPAEETAESTGEPSPLPTDSGAAKMTTGGALVAAVMVAVLMM